MNPQENIETKQSPSSTPETKKTVSQLVEDMGYKRKDAAPYIAQSFGICSKEDYIKARSNPEQNKKYNIDIRNFILKGKKFEMPLKTEKLQKFDAQKQALLKKNFFALDTKTGTGGFAGYINGLSDAQIQKLNTLEPTQFVGFCKDQIKEAQTMTNTLSREGESGRKELQTATLEQVSNAMLLTKMEEKLQAFKESHATLKTIPETTPAELDQTIKTFSPETWTKYIDSYGSEADAKRSVKIALDAKKIQESEQFHALPPSEQKEFTTITSEYYRHIEHIGMTESLQTIWSPEMLTMVQKESKEPSPSTSALDQSTQDILRGIHTDYFADMQTLIPEGEKSLQYTQDLAKMFPSFQSFLQNPLHQRYLKDYTDAQGNIIETKLMQAPEDEQAQVRNFHTKLLALSQGAETTMLQETKQTMQTQAVKSCMHTLQNYLDIDVSAQENVLEQLQVETNQVQDSGKEVQLAIHARIAGKPLTLNYNLTTGTLQYEEVLHKETPSGPYTLNAAEQNMQALSLIQLPTFADMQSAAKDMSYAKLLQKSTTLEDYTQQLSQELDARLTKQGAFPPAIEKQYFEKALVQNMITQESLTLMDLPMDQKQVIDASTHPQFAHRFELLRQTYMTSSLEELQTLRTNIKALQERKTRYTATAPEIKATREEDNKERYTLSTVFDANIAIQKGEGNQPKFQANALIPLLDCFAISEANVQVLDIAKMSNFIQKSDQAINQEANTTGARKRTTTFNALADELKDKYLMNIDDMFKEV